MLELVYRIVSKTIAHTGLGVRVPSPVEIIEPPKRRFFNFYWGRKQTALLSWGREGRSDVRVLPKAKASTASPGPVAFSVRKMTKGRVPSPVNFSYKNALFRRCSLARIPPRYARVNSVYFASSRLELRHFSLKNYFILFIFSVGRKQTALLSWGLEARSDV